MELDELIRVTIAPVEIPSDLVSIDMADIERRCALMLCWDADRPVFSQPPSSIQEARAMVKTALYGALYGASPERVRRVLG